MSQIPHQEEGWAPPWSPLLPTTAHIETMGRRKNKINIAVCGIFSMSRSILAKTPGLVWELDIHMGNGQRERR